MRGSQDLSQWTKEEADFYARAKHGPDGRRFLDPILFELMQGSRLGLKNVLDIGAGTGSWTKFALDQGAVSATAVDLSPGMVEQARQNLSDSSGNLDSRARVILADVAQLPFENSKFNFLLSINVGCNLPDQTFSAHFQEAYRVAENGSEFVVTAPHSLLQPFTVSSDHPDIQEFINEAWKINITDRLEKSPKQVIGSADFVLRATFVLDQEGKPILITQKNSDLVYPGAPIIRKIPGLAVDNNFHIAQEYCDAAQTSGWQIVEQYEDSFPDSDARRVYNDSVGDSEQLGPQYVCNPPFLVLHLRKE